MIHNFPVVYEDRLGVYEVCIAFYKDRLVVCENHLMMHNFLLVYEDRLRVYGVYLAFYKDCLEVSW